MRFYTFYNKTLLAIVSKIMDYSQLVTALRDNDSSKANELIKALMPRLMSFLRIHMNASREDAEDCAQEALLSIIETIKEDKLREPEHLMSYLLSTCRNNYLKVQDKNHNRLYDMVEDDQQTVAPQLEAIFDEEQQQILEHCLKQLKKKYREFMIYWFEHPGAHAEKVASRFNISVNNVWTRKHRLIKKLNECYRKKSKF